MDLSHEHVGPQVLAKIKIYTLTRAELLFLFAMRYPVVYLISAECTTPKQERQNRDT